MYQRQEVFSTLFPEDIAATLNACMLLEKDEYTEDEVYRFRECRSLIEQGKSYEEVAQSFLLNGITPVTETQLTESTSTTKSKKSKGKKLSKPSDTPELDDREALFATVDHLTAKKAEDIKSAIAKSTVELEVQMVEVSQRMLLQRLSEMASSGDIEEAMDWERQRLMGKPEGTDFNLMDRYHAWLAKRPRPQLKPADEHQHLLPESQE